MAAVDRNPGIAAELQLDVPGIVVTALIAMRIHELKIEVADELVVQQAGADMEPVMIVSGRAEAVVTDAAVDFLAEGVVEDCTHDVFALRRELTGRWIRYIVGTCVFPCVRMVPIIPALIARTAPLIIAIHSSGSNHSIMFTDKITIMIADAIVSLCRNISSCIPTDPMSVTPVRFIIDSNIPIFDIETSAEDMRCVVLAPVLSRGPLDIGIVDEAVHRPRLEVTELDVLARLAEVALDPDLVETHFVAAAVTAVPIIRDIALIIETSALLSARAVRAPFRHDSAVDLPVRPRNLGREIEIELFFIPGRTAGFTLLVVTVCLVLLHIFLSEHPRPFHIVGIFLKICYSHTEIVELISELCGELVDRGLVSSGDILFRHGLRDHLRHLIACDVLVTLERRVAIAIDDAIGRELRDSIIGPVSLRDIRERIRCRERGAARTHDRRSENCGCQMFLLHR